MKQPSPKQQNERLVSLFEDSGDINLIGQLFENHREYFRCCLHKTNFPDVDDILSESYIKIQHAFLNNKYQPSKTATLRTWLMRIVLNAAVDHVRKLKITPGQKGVELDMPIGDKENSRAIDVFQVDDCTKEFLGTSIEELPSIIGLYKLVPHGTKRSIMSKTVFEHRLMGFKFSEIAELTGINHNTLRGYWARDVKVMHDMFKSGMRNTYFTEANMLEIELRGIEIRTELELKPEK
jgi:DNA-directed RNA polymerase specialized sigma24 family protein